LRKFGAATNPPSLDDFVLFGGRLETLQRQMRDWRPRRIRDLFTPGYGDRFTWYTQMFFLAIGVIGLFGLILSVVQTVYAIFAYKDSVELALKSLEIAVRSLNVSLESLALQKLQLNITS
jgi:quinol-cytochrome oxidoreductase complex cytochrome b subunit